MINCDGKASRNMTRSRRNHKIQGDKGIIIRFYNIFLNLFLPSVILLLFYCFLKFNACALDEIII